MDLRAFIFMPALVGATIFGFVFLLFLAHYYLNVLESTASGARHIAWSRDPVTDNFWEFWYLAWLFTLWLGPAFFLGRALTAGIDSTWVKMMAPLLVLWICYPLSQLSSLSASSRWLPLVPDVFSRLLQKPRVTLEFFGLSALVLVVFAIGFYWTFLTQGDWHLLFIGSPLVVVATFLYSRLLGRLAFVMRFTNGMFSTKGRKKLPIEGSTEEKSGAKPKPRNAHVYELPPLSTPDGELTGYDVTFEDAPPRVPKKRVKAELVDSDESKPTESAQRAGLRPAPESALERARVWSDEDDEETSAYVVREAEVKPEDRIPQDVVKPRDDEIRLLTRADRPKQPRRVWGLDLLAFLIQPGTIWSFVVASGMCFGVGALVRLTRVFNPAVGGE